MTAFPAWYYDELKQVGVDFENVVQVEAYDRKQTSNTPEVNRELIQRLGICQGHTVIEIGTGTGSFAIEAALTGACVYAVDVSAAMLAYARQKACVANVGNIEFHQAGFLTYEHQGEPVDFIVTKAALHHLPDFWKMIAFLRMHSMLKPGGVFYLRDVVFSFPPPEYRSRIDAWIDRVAKPTSEGFTKEEFEMHVREEHSTFAWIIEGMLTRSGFEIVEKDYPTSEYAQYICRKI